MDTQKTLNNLVVWGMNLPDTLNRLCDDKELFSILLETFLADKTFSSLGEKLEAEDFKGAFEDAHNLKGVSGNLGLTPLFDAICILVESLRHNNHANLDAEYTYILATKEKLESLIVR